MRRLVAQKQKSHFKGFCLVGQPLCAGNLKFSFACKDDQIPLNGSRITCDLGPENLSSQRCFGGCFFPPLLPGADHRIQLPLPLLFTRLRFIPVPSIAISSLIYILLFGEYITRAVWAGKGCFRQGRVRLTAFLSILYHDYHFLGYFRP